MKKMSIYNQTCTYNGIRGYKAPNKSDPQKNFCMHTRFFEKISIEIRNAGTKDLLLIFSNKF